MIPIQSAFHIALASLSAMTPAERKALSAACAAYDADTTTPPAVIGSHDGVTYYADGTVSRDDFEAYFAINPGVSTIHNFFFNDTDAFAAAAGIDLPKEALDNIAYNRSVSTTPFFTGAAYSAVSTGKQFDPKSVKGLPYALAFRSKLADAATLLSQWKASGYVPSSASNQIGFS